MNADHRELTEYIAMLMREGQTAPGLIAKALLTDLTSPIQRLLKEAHKDGRMSASETL